MRVRADTKQRQIDRQSVFIFDRVVLCAGRDIDAQRVKVDSKRGIGWRLSGEVKCDGWLNQFRFSVGMKVQLQDQIRVGLQRPGQSCRPKLWRFAGLPAQKMAVWHPGCFRERHAIESGWSL